MHTLLRRETGVRYGASMADHAHGSTVSGTVPPAPLIHVLWRRRWAVILSVTACLLAGAAYILVARPIYSATAKIRVDQNGPRVYSDVQGYIAESETYLQTQADVVQSTGVL